MLLHVADNKPPGGLRIGRITVQILPMAATKDIHFDCPICGFVGSSAVLTSWSRWAAERSIHAEYSGQIELRFAFHGGENFASSAAGFA
jgi:hypothetical protein